jgi:dihydroxyacetone kinase
VIVDAKILDISLRLACKRAIDAEPNLTKWDLVMGDGDCGEGVKGVTEDILRRLDGTNVAPGSVFSALTQIIEAVDDMGGSLGAIFGV